MVYERIDVSSVYSHLIWAHFFLIYLIMSCIGVYSIWTDLREVGVAKENWIMFGLVLLWMVLATIIYKITESL